MSNQQKPYKWQEELAHELEKQKGGVYIGRSGYPQQNASMIMSLVNMAKRRMIQQEIQEFVDRKLGNKD